MKRWGGVWRAGLGVIAALAIVPAASQASATFTYPANGQTVTLDKRLSFDFRWTLPASEEYPDVYVGDQPRFDPTNDFSPFESWCGGQALIASSCRLQSSEGIIPVAGTHYAVISTTPGGFTDVPNVSPEIRFFVPYRIGLGCAPTAGCEWPRLHSAWYRFGDASYGHPWSDFNIWAWTNGAKLTMGFTLRHGHRILKRGRRTTTANVLFDVPEPDHLEVSVYHQRGIAVGTRLTLTITLTSGNARLTRTYVVHAGGGPAFGVFSMVG
jgi:hypothetical protein